MVKDETSKPKIVKTPKPKIGDKVKFYDDLGKEFPAVIEKLNNPKVLRGFDKPIISATIRVSRLRGHSQRFLSVPYTTNKKIQPRF